MILRIVGRTLIATGLTILLFLGYQLWGTTLVAQQYQKTLARELVDAPAQLAEAADTEESGAELGQGIARILIPKIDVDWIVVEGVSVEDLKKGPGHYPDTALPGQTGNAGIAGHRTTYGAPFYRLDELKMGDPIRIQTSSEIFEYLVSETKIVAPTDTSVLDQTSDSRLTLTTCHPRFSAKQRLIVVAVLAAEPGIAR